MCCYRCWLKQRLTGANSCYDAAANQLGLEKDLRLLNSYTTAAGDKLWIITEADRSVTTILLPEAY